jgi:hypothetical protein
MKDVDPLAIALELLNAHGWNASKCARCKRAFLARSRRKTCQSPSCFQRVYEGNRPRAMSLPQLWDKIREEFLLLGYSEHRAKDLTQGLEDSLFVFAAIQNFNDVMHRGIAPPRGNILIAQASIRMRYFDSVDNEEGFGTSFVNVGTYRFHDAPNAFRDHLQDWLRVWAKLGLDDHRITFTREKTPFRADGYWGRYLVVNYDGIELGEAVLISQVRTTDGRLYSMVEFGFGLERILWAVNGTAKYHRNCGPLTARIRDDSIIADSVRTSTLMAMIGIAPGQKAQGFRMRKSVSRLRGSGHELRDAIRLCHAEWSEFAGATRNADACADIILYEISRQNCLELARQLGVKEGLAIEAGSAEAMLRILVESGTAIDDLCKRFDIANKRPGPTRRKTGHPE